MTQRSCLRVQSAAEWLQCRCAACKPVIPLIPTNSITLLVQRKNPKVLIQMCPLSFRWTAVVLSVDPSLSRCVTRLKKNRDVVFVKVFLTYLLCRFDHALMLLLCFELYSSSCGFNTGPTRITTTFQRFPDVALLHPLIP